MSAVIKKINENITATFDKNTGTVNLYSNNGTLQKNWIQCLDVISRDEIRSICVAEGRVYLPQDADAIFQYYSNLVNLDLSGFDASNVASMVYMFHGCIKLEKLDLNSFDTSNVTNMSSMFYDCSGLTGLNLSSFDTSNVTDMSEMFYDCGKLTNLNLSSFDTSRVTAMEYMFSGCRNLTELDLKSFDTSNVIFMRRMFRNCKKLKYIRINPMVKEDAETDYIFENCRAEII